MNIHRFRQACNSLLVGAALLAASATQAARIETAGPLAAPQIVGRWSWTDESQCVEIYPYRSDRTGPVSSGNEQTDVSIVLSSVPVADDFFGLNVTIRHDSGGNVTVLGGTPTTRAKPTGYSCISARARTVTSCATART